MSAPYTVSWADRAGPAGYQEFDTFEEALKVYRETADARNGRVAYIIGDGAEFDGENWDDGLTDEERECL